MERHFIIKCFIFLILFVVLLSNISFAGDAPISEDTEMCLDCHASLHPGIVEAWKKSAHAKSTLAEGITKTDLEKLISTDKVPDTLANNTVGCAECHTINPDQHKDSFDHNDYQVHSIVTPGDCSMCHPVEATQYGDNLMSHAYGNIQKNPVFRSLADSINGLQTYEGMVITHTPPDADTDADSCLYCHGTEIKVKGTKTIETDYDDMIFPVLAGWPNQGVGRINPDNTRGSCAACHPRHKFDIETARKPSTCSECHKGPDVPAYGVYSVSKHGNIYSSNGGEWDFKSVPWTAGRDFTAPTCAACHISLITNEDGEVVSKRTHRMNDRIYTRIFGLIYAHAHPKSPDTTIINNSAGMSLPTELTGEPAGDYLIDKPEQDKRKDAMQKVCMSCHSMGWVGGHFSRLGNTIKTTNEMTLTATKILLSAWERGAAKGLAQGDDIFNEAIEKKWVEQWLFYANSTRFASAMAGADYGAFANGRWNMSKNIQDMMDWLKIRLEMK